MTEQRSPWAVPDTEVVVSGAEPVSSPPVTAAPAYAMAHSSARHGTPPQRASRPEAAGGRTATLTAGAVTRLHEPGPPDVISSGPPDVDDPARRNRLIMRWFGGGAIGVIAIGLIVVLAMIMTGAGTGPGNGLLDRQLKGPSDTRPELAKRCPPPSDSPDQGQQGVPAIPAGPRTVDEAAGISYKAYGAPWSPWDSAWVDQGELKVSYRVGQHFVTEENYRGSSDYHATILSGSVPAAVNDGLQLDLKCTGHQVAADARISFYPEPNTLESIRDEAATLGGRPAWVNIFRLSFTQPGLKAKSELVLVALIDVGRPEAAILYVSIPDTHRQFDTVVDELLESVRPT